MAGDESKAAVGRRVAGVRRQQELSQADFAKRVGLTLAALIALEDGKSELAPSTAKLISTKYGVTSEYLFIGL